MLTRMFHPNSRPRQNTTMMIDLRSMENYLECAEAKVGAERVLGDSVGLAGNVFGGTGSCPQPPYG